MAAKSARQSDVKTLASITGQPTEDVVAMLKQYENGIAVADLCRDHGLSQARSYKWRSKFGGMDTSMIKRMKEVEGENRRLKKMYADVQLQNDVIKEAMGKKW